MKKVTILFFLMIVSSGITYAQGASLSSNSSILNCLLMGFIVFAVIKIWNSSRTIKTLSEEYCDLREMEKRFVK